MSSESLFRIPVFSTTVILLLAVTVARADDKFASFNANPLLVAPTEALSPEEQQKKFHLPPGFAIELVAAEPTINKPMNLAFDAKGRLWVTHSTNYPYPNATNNSQGDAVKILVDTDGDGRADVASTFVSGLNIPIGLLPIGDELLCYSIPSIDRFSDPNKVGKGTARKKLFGEFGFRDTHGMASSFNYWIDGWVYATHGFSNDSEVKGADQRSVKMHSGNTYRFRPDGSHVEQFSHGQVNPFGMCFDPLGNIYTADCHTKPVYQILRGAWYPMFGDVHDGLGMGPEMMTHSHGSTGIAGVVYYTGNYFPPEYEGTLFVGNPVTGRVNHDKIAWHGSSPKAIEQPDFIRCDDPWFRPVNIQLGPDGALYIADFYNKIIGHYEVPLEHPARDRARGRIWRVVRTDKPRQTPYQNRSATADELISRLGSGNLSVRVQATHSLVELGPVPATMTTLNNLVANRSESSWNRIHAMWVLERLGQLKPGLLEQMLMDPSRDCRVHSVKLAGERRSVSPELRESIVKALQDPDSFVKRSAADALGLHPSAQNAAPLLAAWKSADAMDSHLIHTQRMSLRDNLSAADDLTSLCQQIAQNDDDLRRLANVSLGLPTPKSARFLLFMLQGNKLNGPIYRDTLTHVAKYAEAKDLALLANHVVQSESNSSKSPVEMLSALYRGYESRGEAFPAKLVSWATDWANAKLVDPSEESARQALEFCRQLRLGESFSYVGELAKNTSKHQGLRFPAMETLLAIDANRARPILSTILESDADPLPFRAKAAEVLGLINLPESAVTLDKILKTAPDQLAVSIARGLSRTDRGSELLLSSIALGKAPARLLRDGVVAHELRFRTVMDKDSRIALLTKDLPAEDSRLADLVKARKSHFATSAPQSKKGKEVFAQACAKCHQIGGVGAKIGPQLDGVGIRGVDRLLEDVLKPNENVDQAFRTTMLVLSDGRLVTGLFLREEGESVILGNAEGKEVRVGKSEIEERKESRLSPMPADVAIQLPADDFAHLLAYLMEQRQPADK